MSNETMSVISVERTPKQTHHFIRSIRKRHVYFLYKEIIDKCISLFILIGFMSWLLPIIAIAIKVTSNGPVFFVQRRVGRYGKTFKCLKFRTMRMNIEADFKQAEENDMRITAIGRFLRRSNLDEIPQFLNVLMGHMSIVGPRPHMHKDCLDFTKIVTEYKVRNLVKPGITGMAQIRGFRGPTNTDSSIVMRYNWDAYYVKNASSSLDIKVIIVTAQQTILQIVTLLLTDERLERIKGFRENYRVKKMAA